MRTRRISMAAGIAVGAAIVAVTAMPGLASANVPKALWVATATPVAGGGTSCAKPGYNSVQAAVGAASSGATINVCAGTYTEQVVITKSVTIVGSGSPTIALPAAPTNSTTACDTAPGTELYQADQDGVVVCGPVTVTLKGITVSAAWPSNTCYDSLYGILVAGGATLNFTNSSVSAAGAVPLNGCQGGVGIQDGMAWTTPVEVGHLNLVNSSVSGYQKNGLTIDGAGSTADIDGATVTGIGPTTQIAQNGIQVSNGATAQINGSTITGDECNVAVVCGPDASTQYGGTAVLLYAAGALTSVTNSTISNSDAGVYYSADPSGKAPVLPLTTIANDTLTNDRYQGVQLDQGAASIDGVVINGGNVGIQVLQYVGQTFGVRSYALADLIRNESVAAVQVLSDQAPSGDLPGTFTIAGSGLGATNAATVLNNSSNVHVVQVANH